MSTETESLVAINIRAKRFKSILDPFAEELSRFFARLEKTEIYCVESYLALARTAARQVQIPVDQMVKALGMYCKQSSLSEFHMIFQDAGVCRETVYIDSFVAECIMLLWGQLPQIHQEHTKQTPPSQTGPSLGLKSYSVYVRGVTQLPRVASYQSTGQAQQSLPPKESLVSRLTDFDGFEEDDLYR